MKIIQQAAEAIILKYKNKVIKNRIKKSYRIAEIDNKLRKQRTKKEAKLLEKLQDIIKVPKLIKVKDEKIIMQHIEGKKLSENLDKIKNKSSVTKQIGQTISTLHNNNIIHGDLTTSNMLWTKDNKLFFIDFGLSFHSSRIEDKAVDLHLLRQALEAKHFSCWKNVFNSIIKSYDANDKNKILSQLEKVEARGRYKH